MRILYTLLLPLLFVTTAFSQAPQKMSYQAVIRDGFNQLVTSSQVGMQISILQGSISGTPVYVEMQKPISNLNGLVTIVIGEGSVVTGDFTTIDWSDGPYFIKTETDPDGDTNYTITGTSQLLSVPYALHAATADSLTGGGNMNESDPIFETSVASGITSIDTMNWNHNSAGSGSPSSMLHTRAYLSSANELRFTIAEQESSTEPFVQMPVPRAGTIKNMFIYPAGDTPNSNCSVTATLRVNGSDTPLQVVQSGTDGINVTSNTTDEVAVSAGDLISVKIEETNGFAPNVVYRVSFEF